MAYLHAITGLMTSYQNFSSNEIQKIRGYILSEDLSIATGRLNAPFEIFPGIIPQYLFEMSFGRMFFSSEDQIIYLIGHGRYATMDKDILI